MPPPLRSAALPMTCMALVVALPAGVGGSGGNNSSVGSNSSRYQCAPEHTRWQSGSQGSWVDLSTSASAPRCPPGWRTAPTVGDTCYLLSSHAAAFGAAAAQCTTVHGGALAILRDSDAQRFLQEHILPRGGARGGEDRYWIGATRTRGREAVDWVGGGRSAFTNFGPGGEGKSPSSASQASHDCVSVQCGSTNNGTCSSGYWVP